MCALAIGMKPMLPLIDQEEDLLTSLPIVQAEVVGAGDDPELLCDFRVP